MKTNDLEERVIDFTVFIIDIVEHIKKTYAGNYYGNQLIRSSGGASLNFGEAQGIITNKDFIFKVGLAVKELKESRNSLKIINYINEGDEIKRALLLKEVEELVAIASKMIINKK